MTAPTKMTGQDAELTIDGVVIAHSDFEMSWSRGTVTQPRAGAASPRKQPGMTDVKFKFTNLDILGDHMAKLLADAGGSGTNLVIDACDSSSNWAASAGVLSVETLTLKEGAGSLHFEPDASGNTLIATVTKDLTGYHYITVWIRSSVAGASVLSMGFGEAAITEQTHAITIQQADVWQKEMFDISAIPDSSKNGVTLIGFTMLSGVGTADIYFDDINGLKGFKLGRGTQFTLIARATDPTDSTRFVEIMAPNCFFTSATFSWKDASTFIDGPVSGEIEDADEIVITPT